jgi:hypothetical protein
MAMDDYVFWILRNVITEQGEMNTHYIFIFFAKAKRLEIIKAQGMPKAVHTKSYYSRLLKSQFKM